MMRPEHGMGSAKKYYAVARGRNPGIYTAWFGADGAEAQVRGYAGARYKGFPSLAEARKWMENQQEVAAAKKRQKQAKQKPGIGLETPGRKPGTILVHTDGGCRGNPGPGGYGAVILDGEKRTELAQGFRLTTNNRMELMACIVALEALKAPSEVVLHSDSRYVVNGMNKGWARKWRANDWMRTKREAAENADLWARMLALCELHRVEFVWVRGHSGHPENERCDALATGAADGVDLVEDQAYLQGRTRIVTSLFDERE
jgi:ribonuclease HI